MHKCNSNLNLFLTFVSKKLDFSILILFASFTETMYISGIRGKGNSDSLTWSILPLVIWNLVKLQGN